MKTIYIRYDGWTPFVLGDAVSGQVNTLRCSFSFSGDWDAYQNRKAIFETDDARKEESLDENGSCLIPRVVLTKRGKLKISAYGTETGENGELLRYNGRPAEIIVDLGGNVDGEITDDPVYPQIGEAVLYTAQSLTEEQKAQARANIGAGTPYTLPEASPDALGGVKADAAETTDTQPVRKGTDGKLYTAPGSDTSIGITGASAGQIPKVKAVDESGAPTEWKAEKDTTPFIVTIGTTSSGYTSSHTFDEIVAAASAGRVVMAYTDYIDFPQPGQSLYRVYFDLDSTQDVAIFVYIDPWNMIKYTFAVDPSSISASASYLSATSSTFGGVKADAAEAADTQPVRIGGDGKLYTAPGSGGADISLGISGATAGQMAKIKAVNASGAPTAWEAGDAASGGIDWQLVDSKTLPAENSVSELEWTGLDCENLYFSATIEYGANITCTGVYVNGVLAFKDWYQFQHVSGTMTNTVLILKMPERYRAEAIGSYGKTSIYERNWYVTYEGKIDSIKFIFENPFTKAISLSLYKGGEMI